MIAADTSSLVPYFEGEHTPDTDMIEAALADGRLHISPIVLTELLSDPKSRGSLQPIVTAWPLLEPTPGYWVRASHTRALVLGRRLKARLPDTLIAQASIDYRIPLITRDPDFEPFAKHCGLRLA